MAGIGYYVLDATVNKTEKRFRGLAAKYVEWEVLNNGGLVVDDPQKADIILATVVSPHEYKCLPAALKRIKVEPLSRKRVRQKVILGGQGATSPIVFDPYVDASVVGEGRTFIKTMVLNGLENALKLENVWLPGGDREVIPDYDFPWDAPPVMAEDGVVRVFASRSCKKKCLFCHTGWSMTYRENDAEKLVEQYDKLIGAGYRVNVVTNDAPALSFFDEMTALEHFSASYSQTRELVNDKVNGVRAMRGKVKSVRFGVEAPSTRLRRLIGKPVDTEGLFDLSAELMNNGIGVRWFMIAGLPGEKAEDYDDLKKVVTNARHYIKKGALQLSFTAFCPDAAAPLCLAPLDDTYWERFDDFWKWFFEREGFTSKIQLFRCAGVSSRLEHAKASMGATEDELRRGWLDKDPPNWRVKYAYRHMARKAYDVYASRVGLPVSMGVV